jgi:putative flippase GtrA
MVLLHAGLTVTICAPAVFAAAALVNYLLCVLLLFRHQARWKASMEWIAYGLLVCGVAGVDWFVTDTLISIRCSPMVSKLTGTAMVLVLNFLGRRFLVFPEKPSGPWRPQRP